MKIYTRTGDNGETGFIGGRISKNSDLIEAIGSLDELNASIGILSTVSLQPAQLKEKLLHIQHVIFNYGALLADVEMQSRADDGDNRDITDEIEILESEIDKLDAELPVLQNFILPGGSPVAAHLHLARTVCRRAERKLVALSSNEPNLQLSDEYISTIKEITRYINRLSDWLFIYARWANKHLGVTDIEWNKLG